MLAPHGSESMLPSSRTSWRRNTTKSPAFRSSGTATIRAGGATSKKSPGCRPFGTTARTSLPSAALTSNRSPGCLPRGTWILSSGGGTSFKWSCPPGRAPGGTCSCRRRPCGPRTTTGSPGAQPAGSSTVQRPGGRASVSASPPCGSHRCASTVHRAAPRSRTQVRLPGAGIPTSRSRPSAKRSSFAKALPPWRSGCETHRSAVSSTMGPRMGGLPRKTPTWGGPA
mmetsp:Transcript_17103/g.53599  ORF Transcript_17103/g.53599 Transcript_17103/m.53599 type:complete len:226 (+) Transcript_17103:318-995(+)